jgi:hypothetical protein
MIFAEGHGKLAQDSSRAHEPRAALVFLARADSPLATSRGVEPE